MKIIVLHYHNYGHVQLSTGSCDWHLYVLRNNSSCGLVQKSLLKKSGEQGVTSNMIKVLILCFLSCFSHHKLF